MSQKIKAIILIIIIFIATLGVGTYLYKNKSDMRATNLPQNVQQQEVTDASVEQVQPPESKEVIVEGKVRSINDKQIYIELADGSGSAINIEPSVSVLYESDAKLSGLNVLEAGMVVSVTVDEKNDAKYILIKK